jgi:hypothetical protein
MKICFLMDEVGEPLHCFGHRITMEVDNVFGVKSSGLESGKGRWVDVGSTKAFSILG